MDGAQTGQIAQAKGFIDTLHDALTPLPLFVIAGQIGMQPLRQVDVQPFRFGRLGRQPAARGRGNVRSARYAAASRAAKRRTGEEVFVVFQIELIEIELVQVPGVERRPQPGHAMTEVGGRAFQASQLGE